MSAIGEAGFSSESRRSLHQPVASRHIIKAPNGEYSSPEPSRLFEVPQGSRADPDFFRLTFSTVSEKTSPAGETAGLVSLGKIS
jgi:hypothetical protein